MTLHRLLFVLDLIENFTTQPCKELDYFCGGVLVRRAEIVRSLSDSGVKFGKSEKKIMKTEFYFTFRKKKF